MNLARFKKAWLAVACCAVVFSCASWGAAAATTAGTGPNEQNALAAEEAITVALRENDTQALKQLLAEDWIVISTSGGRGSRDYLLAQIKAGYFTRKSLAISNSRVRVYGDTALVTSHVATSGTLVKKPFDVQECQTDILVWKGGSWVSELLHETKIIHQTNC